MRCATSMPLRPGVCTSRKQTVGRRGLEAIQRLNAIARLGHQLQLGPVPGQQAAQYLAQQGLVVGKECGDRGGDGGHERAGELDLGQHAMGRGVAEPQLGRALEAGLQALAQ